MSTLTAYLLLGVSVVTEIVATSTLPATKGFTKLKPSLVSIIGYIICFFCMGIALTKINLGIAYGTWGALGTAVTPIIGYIAYKQKTTKAGWFGVLLTVIGVFMLNMYG